MKALPVPGIIFDIDGYEAFVIAPEKRSGMPWIWYAPSLPGLPGPEESWMFQRFLNAGIAIAGIDVGETYGSPKGTAIYSIFYRELVGTCMFSEKPCLLVRSRGGLMLYNWAVKNSRSVSCVAGIYPVCNLLSFPGVDRACAAYGMTESEVLHQYNPVERMEPLAEAGVPIFHIHGDRDEVVPLEANSGELAKSYHRLGGTMILRVAKGQGHDMWPGWFQCQELVDFIIRHAR